MLIREEIVIWARKKTGMPVIRITSIIEAEEFRKKHPMYVVGLFEKFEVRAFIGVIITTMDHVNLIQQVN